MIRPVLVRREKVVPGVQAVAIVVGIAVALALGAILLWVSDHSPVEVYERMFDSAFWGIDSLSRTLERATPLALTGLAVAVAGSMGLWNIGAEGQMMAGATVATGMAMMADGLSGPALIALMVVAGVIGGMVLMVGPALARSYLGVSEIITTLMLVYVARRVVEWLKIGPWKDPDSMGFAVIEPVPEQASLPGLFGRANIGALIALGLLLALSLAVSRTPWGYELRLAGSSPDTARYAGISLRAKVLTALLLSGGIAGLAGVVQLTGSATRLEPDLSNNYGFAGIIVAALALMRPSGVAVVAIVFGAVQVGGQSIQTLEVSSAISDILQAMILFGALAVAVFLNYRIRWTSPAGLESPGDAAIDPGPTGGGSAGGVSVDPGSVDPGSSGPGPSGHEGGRAVEETVDV